MLDFRINTFLTVCSYMNFSKASEELHITQPAVSQHIQYLEKLYDTKLFIHEGKKLKLSNSGKLLLHTATTIKNDQKFMIDQFHTHPNNVPIHFGVTRTIGEFVISKPLISFIKNHPNSEIKLISSNTQELLQKLKTGEIHFALIEGYFPRDQYDYIAYSCEDFVAVSSTNHEFNLKINGLNNLFSETLIVREQGSGSRLILEKNLDLRNHKITDFNQIIEISNIKTIIDLVKADCGITFIYKTAVLEELKNNTLQTINLKDFKMQHDFTFIWNKGSAFEYLYKQICKEFQENKA